MAEPHLWLRGEFGPAAKGAWGTIVGWHWSNLVPRNSPVAWRDILLYWQGFRVRIEQG